MKIQKAVRDETAHIALGVLVLSLVMQGIFLVLGQWDYTVVLGNLLGGGYAILNFFVLGRTVQKVAGDGDEKRGKNLMQFSYSARMFVTMMVALLGMMAPVFHWVAVVAPLLFPRVTIFVMGLMGNKKGKKAA